MTRPLSPHAVGVLRSLARGPLASPEVNAGVGDKFRREGLAVIENRPSPYASTKGRPYPHFVITPEGLAYLEALDASQS